MNELKTGLYKPFKGGKYEVIGIAKHSETLEDFVVYKALYDNKVSKLWIIPKEMFTESIIQDGKSIKRFEFIG